MVLKLNFCAGDIANWLMIDTKLLGVAWENLLVGVLSAGIIVLATFIRKWYINYRVEKKYPVAGNYLSKFEDEVEGVPVTITAPALIKQKGKNIYGETSLSNDNRKWILDGKISSGGHIHGIYYAEDPYDKGIGNFFLFINYRRQMEGLWSGFDSLNRKISSGRYSFEPIINDVSIRSASKSDFAKILEISDIELGKDYFNPNIKQELKSENCIFRVAQSEKDGIIGFSYSYITDGLSVGMEISVSSLPKYFKVSSKIAVLKTIAVNSSKSGKGVGSSLMKDTISQCRSLNVDYILCIAWKTSKGINLGGLMSLYNFRVVLEIQDYWKEDSINREYNCPECGNPCQCTAVCYAKAL